MGGGNICSEKTSTNLWLKSSSERKCTSAWPQYQKTKRILYIYVGATAYQWCLIRGGGRSALLQQSLTEKLTAAITNRETIKSTQTSFHCTKKAFACRCGRVVFSVCSCFVTVCGDCILCWLDDVGLHVLRCRVDILGTKMCWLKLNMVLNLNIYRLDIESWLVTVFNMLFYWIFSLKSRCSFWLLVQ